MSVPTCDICGRMPATPIPSALIDGRPAMMCEPCRKGAGSTWRRKTLRTLDDIAGAAGFLAAIATAAALWAAPAQGQDQYHDECPDAHEQGARLVLTIRNGASTQSKKIINTCAGRVVLAITIRAGYGEGLHETYSVVEAPDGLIAWPVQVDVNDLEEATFVFLPAIM